MIRSLWVWRLARFADPFSFYTFVLTISWNPNLRLAIGCKQVFGLQQLVARFGPQRRARKFVPSARNFLLLLAFWGLGLHNLAHH